MRVETERLDTHEALLTVTIEADQVEQAKRAAAKRFSREVNIPGFRKGKAPYARVAQLVGEESLLKEGISDLAEKVYPKVLEESGVTPYAPGWLENIETGESPVITFRVPLRPEVELGAYREVRVPFEEPEITDEMVNAALDDLRQERAVVEPADRAAGWGDLVELDVFGELLPEGQETPVEDAEVAPENLLLDEEAFEVVLDKERDILPGFSEQIVGMAADDEKSFVLDIPADHEVEAMRGRRAAFEVTCRQVNSRTLPTLNDTFAADVSNGEHETLLELRLEVRRVLHDEAVREAEEPYADEVLQKIIEGATLTYPPVMVDEYVDDILRDMDQNLRARNGLTLEDYLRLTEKSVEQLREESREAAERRLQRALVLGEILKAEELELTDEELEVEIAETAARLGELGKVWRDQIKRKEAREAYHMRVLSRRVKERVIAIAKGEDPPKGPTPKPKLEEKVTSEHVATLDDMRDQIAQRREGQEIGKLFPEERIEGGIVRIDKGD